MKNGGSFLLGCLLLLCSLNSLAAELTSSVDRTRLSMEETLTLTVRYNSQTDNEPDFSLLDSSFEILSRSPQSQMYNINGRISVIKQWVITLAPRDIGKHFIPSFNIDGNFSDAIEITVTEAGASSSGKTKEVFVETLVDKTQAYVQEQIIIKYRLYYAVNVEALESGELELPDVNIEALPDARYRTNIDGIEYYISEYSYALFPQTSGTLEIPAQRWSVRINKNSRPRSLLDFGTGRFETRRLHTESKTITIKPQPSTFPADATWLPASDLSIREQWTQDPQTMVAGEPITRTLSLNAEGLTASQLPVMMTDMATGPVKLYLDQAQLDTETQAEKGVISQRIESAAVVVNQGGNATLPAVKIPWWDTNTDTLRYAELPAKNLQIQGNVNPDHKQTLHDNVAEPTEQARATATPVNETNQALDDSALERIKKLENHLFIWRLISLVLLFVVLVLSLLFLLRRPAKTAHADESKAARKKSTTLARALNNIKHSCKTNDAAQTRIHLLNWAQLYWPKGELFTLTDIANRSNHPALSKQLFALDAALYSGTTSGEWDGFKTWKAFEQFMSEDNKQENQEGLPPLYPV